MSFAMLGIDVMYHPGPATMYLGKVPEGETAATWDGSGKQWFKVALSPLLRYYMLLMEYGGSLQIKNWGGSGDPNPKAAEPMWYFETYYENTLTATIPAEVPSGEARKHWCYFYDPFGVNSSCIIVPPACGTHWTPYRAEARVLRFMRTD